AVEPHRDTAMAKSGRQSLQETLVRCGVQSDGSTHAWAHESCVLHENDAQVTGDLARRLRSDCGAGRFGPGGAEDLKKPDREGLLAHVEQAKRRASTGLAGVTRGG